MKKKENKKLAILGFGGHAKVVAEIAFLNGFEKIDFFDDSIKNNQIIGDSKLLAKNKHCYDYFFVAIGDNKIRKQKHKELIYKKFKCLKLVHPNSFVSQSSQIKNGTVVMSGVSINPSCKISEGCIINTNSSIDHDCNIGSFTHICPGVNIAGTVKIGSLSFVGIGSNLVNNIFIKSNSKIKAGSNIIRNL